MPTVKSQLRCTTIVAGTVFVAFLGVLQVFPVIQDIPWSSPREAHLNISPSHVAALQPLESPHGYRRRKSSTEDILPNKGDQMNATRRGEGSKEISTASNNRVTSLDSHYTPRGVHNASARNGHRRTHRSVETPLSSVEQEDGDTGKSKTLPSPFPNSCTLVSQLDATGSYPYPFNSRSFCLLPSICIQPARSAEDPGRLFVKEGTIPPPCQVTSSSLNRKLPWYVNCSKLWANVVLTHGAFPSDDPEGPLRPRILPLSKASPRLFRQARWLDGVAVIMPAYPFHFNIFHFAFAAAQTMHFATSLPYLLRRTHPPKEPLRVTLVLRENFPENLSRWQRDIVTMVMAVRFRGAGLHLADIVSFEETPRMDYAKVEHFGDMPPRRLVCGKGALLMGSRANSFQWPFPNSRKKIPINGQSVPVEAISFRAAAYEAAGVPNRYPAIARGALEPPSERSMFDLPLPVVGYARRNLERDAAPGEVQNGTTRRFSDADEHWLISLLEEEASSVNMSFRTLETPIVMPLTRQIELFSSVGIVVGIHGANLANTMFTPAFSSLLEIANQQFPCYQGGLNSGLWFQSYKPVHLASAEESACDLDPCATDPNHRRVRIDMEKDRTQIRKLLRLAIGHVQMLRNRFHHLGGIPVLYDPISADYHIDWDR